MSTTQQPARYKWLWLLVATTAAALFVDIADGDDHKTISTAALLIGFIGLTLARNTGRRSFDLVAVLGFAGFLALSLYRLALHQGWIG